MIINSKLDEIPKFADCNSKNNGVKINSWKNIHGLACFNDPKAQASLKTQGSIPAPIFGVDPENVLNCRSDARMLFTKPYRLIINKIKNIQQRKINYFT